MDILIDLLARGWFRSDPAASAAGTDTSAEFAWDAYELEEVWHIALAC